MIRFDQIPTAWLEVLEDIQKVCPSAVLAGGALRDLWNDVEVKDIDIFIQAGSESEAWGLFHNLGGERPEPEKTDYGLQDCDDAGVYPESMREVILVEDYPEDKNPTGIPVQLVFVNWKTSKITERFDLGICKIWTDGAKLYTDPEFLTDVNDKLLNIRRCATKSALGASIKRIVRLHPKYPEYDICLDGVKLKEVDDK